MKKITILFLTLFAFQWSNAQNSIFIQYEANSCIQKLNYTVVEASSKSDVKAFTDFQVRLNGTERTVIRTQKVGTYKKADYQIKSKKITCANKEVHIFQSMVGKIRNKQQSVFFLQEDEENLHVYQGVRATYDIYHPNYFYSYSPDYSFKYTYGNNYDPLQTLRYDETTGTTTLFAGKKQRDCRQQFGIYSIPEQTSEAQVNMEFIQDMGILEEQNADGMFTLQSVNGQAVNDYIKTLCNVVPKKEDIPVESDVKISGENTARGDSPIINPPNKSDKKPQSDGKVKIIAKYKSDAPVEYNVNISGENTNKGDAAKKVKVIAPYRGNTGDAPTRYNTKLKGENTAKGGDIKRKKVQIIAPHKEKSSKYQPMNPTSGNESSGKKGDDDAKKPVLTDNSEIPMEYNNPSKKKEVVIINGLPEKYTVKKGDTLFFISKKFEVSMAQLRAWNQMKDNKVYTGEDLIVGVVTAPL